jgi:hypothetical protein
VRVCWYTEGWEDYLQNAHDYRFPSSPCPQGTKDLKASKVAREENIQKWKEKVMIQTGSKLEELNVSAKEMK